MRPTAASAAASRADLRVRNQVSALCPQLCKRYTAHGRSMRKERLGPRTHACVPGRGLLVWSWAHSRVGR